jgi:hypothetical protein
MNPILRNILFVTVFSFALSFDSCFFGTAYDARNQLHPEYSCGCMGCGDTYGQRWVLLGFALFNLFSGSLVAIFIHLRRNEQAEKHFKEFSIYKP